MNPLTPAKVGPIQLYLTLTSLVFSTLLAIPSTLLISASVNNLPSRTSLYAYTNMASSESVKTGAVVSGKELFNSTVISFFSFLYACSTMGI